MIYDYYHFGQIKGESISTNFVILNMNVNVNENSELKNFTYNKNK